jgi:hypothetical protein
VFVVKYLLRGHPTKSHEHRPMIGAQRIKNGDRSREFNDSQYEVEHAA